MNLKTFKRKLYPQGTVYSIYFSELIPSSITRPITGVLLSIKVGSHRNQRITGGSSIIEVGSHEAVSINGGPFTYYVITNGEGLDKSKNFDYVICERSL